MRRHHKGFTLIELLIVVAIVGILAAIAVPRMMQAVRRSKRNRTDAELKSIQTELSLYQLNDSSLPFTDGLPKELGNVFPDISPHKNSWGDPFYYVSDGGDNYCVCSFEKDHLIGPTDCDNAQLSESDFFNCDRCTVNGTLGNLEKCELLLRLAP